MALQQSSGRGGAAWDPTPPSRGLRTRSCGSSGSTRRAHSMSRRVNVSAGARSAGSVSRLRSSPSAQIVRPTWSPWCGSSSHVRSQLKKLRIAADSPSLAARKNASARARRRAPRSASVIASSCATGRKPSDVVDAVAVLERRHPAVGVLVDAGLVDHRAQVRRRGPHGAVRTSGAVQSEAHGGPLHACAGASRSRRAAPPRSGGRPPAMTARLLLVGQLHGPPPTPRASQAARSEHRQAAPPRRRGRGGPRRRSADPPRIDTGWTPPASPRRSRTSSAPDTIWSPCRYGVQNTSVAASSERDPRGRGSGRGRSRCPRGRARGRAASDPPDTSRPRSARSPDGCARRSRTPRQAPSRGPSPLPRGRPRSPCPTKASRTSRRRDDRRPRAMPLQPTTSAACTARRGRHEAPPGACSRARGAVRGPSVAQSR